MFPAQHSFTIICINSSILLLWRETIAFSKTSGSPYFPVQNDLRASMMYRRRTRLSLVQIEISSHCSLSSTPIELVITRIFSSQECFSKQASVASISSISHIVVKPRMDSLIEYISQTTSLMIELDSESLKTSHISSENIWWFSISCMTLSFSAFKQQISFSTRLSLRGLFSRRGEVMRWPPMLTLTLKMFRFFQRQDWMSLLLAYLWSQWGQKADWMGLSYVDSLSQGCWGWDWGFEGFVGRLRPKKSLAPKNYWIYWKVTLLDSTLWIIFMIIVTMLLNSKDFSLDLIFPASACFSVSIRVLRDSFKFKSSPSLGRQG